MKKDWIDYLQGYCRNCRFNKGCRYKSKSFVNLCFVHKPKKRKKKATSKPFFESPVIKKIMKDPKRRKSINEKTKIYEAAAKKKLNWWENFLCNIMDIHDVEPTKYDGCSQHGICKRCGKEGMFDSQGGFF